MYVATSAQWRKSSRSGSGAQSDCVQVAGLAGNIGVRDSKDPADPKIALPSAKFPALLDAVKRGERDLP
ncbi:DUF397 domain-containing protein [Actinomadura sp. LD22]|uniref:DUF397 domain-containing protein n=1 Tax=Actinomadura physcomitrii TaxID=2650748 RepID=A0A6I4M9G6_9ACTN|nr:DUF397 domain-containing protein [Actinomadura physcomitrii]MVZ99328.1 DUF397 domain-containing protein [Actinomadura physcomitrii]